MGKLIRWTVFLGFVGWVFFATTLDEKILGSYSPHNIVINFDDYVPMLRRVAVFGLIIVIGVWSLLAALRTRFGKKDEPAPKRSRKQQPTPAYPMYPPQQAQPQIIVVGGAGRPRNMGGYGGYGGGYGTQKPMGRITRLPSARYTFWDGLTAQMGEQKYDD